jgi:hypothetical protein
MRIYLSGKGIILGESQYYDYFQGNEDFRCMRSIVSLPLILPQNQVPDEGI